MCHITDCLPALFHIEQFLIDRCPRELLHASREWLSCACQSPREFRDGVQRWCSS